MARWQGVATQKGAFGSIPATGKAATWTGISIFRIVDEPGEGGRRNRRRGCLECVPTARPGSAAGVGWIAPGSAQNLQHLYATFTAPLRLRSLPLSYFPASRPKPPWQASQ